MTQKTGPKLILEHTHLYQIIADKDFWGACPEWVDLEKEGKKVHQEIVNRMLGIGDAACTGCSTLQLAIRPFQHKFSSYAVKLYEEDISQLDSFVTYLTRKRGYRPKPIVVYYKDTDGRNRTLEL